MHCALWDNGENGTGLESISGIIHRWRWYLNYSGRYNDDPIILPNPAECHDKTEVILFYLNCRPILYVKYQICSMHCQGYSLDGINYKEPLVDKSELVFNVNTHSLIRSLKLLAKSIELDGVKKKKNRGLSSSDEAGALGVVNTIFREGARFYCLEIAIASKFIGDHSYFGDWALLWMQNWSKISRILQLVKYFKTTNQIPPECSSSSTIDTFEKDMDEVIKGIGLTKWDSDIETKIETVEDVYWWIAVMKYHNVT